MIKTTFLTGKQRHCTDPICLILFIAFGFVYSILAIFILSQGNPNSLIQASDSFGNLCDEYPYQFYFDISKCLTSSGISLMCPTTKLCVQSCPSTTYQYQELNSLELMGNLPKSFTRNQLICLYNFDPINDNRTIIQLVNKGLCAPFSVPSEPMLGRCLPSILMDPFETSINGSFFGVNSLGDVLKIIFTDLNRIKISLILFTVIGGVLTLLYMFAVQQLTGLIVTVTIILFLFILGTISSFCWYTILTGEDFVYEYSTVARMVNDFIQLRTIYIVFGCVTTFVLFLSLILICVLFERIRLSIILLDQAATAVFSVLSTLFWSPLIILVFFALTAAMIYVQMCLSTVGKAIFRTTIDNQSIPCLPDVNSTDCLFQQSYGYDDLVLKDIDPITGGVIEFLVDYQQVLKWFNLFAYLWFSSFLFAFEDIVLAGVFSNYYWSGEQFSSSFPLFYSFYLVVRYHLGSVAFGSLLIAVLKYIRMIFEYIEKKVEAVRDNLILGCLIKCFSCLLWIFEKFLKFLNKNAYILIISRGYSFCKATRKAFGYVITNSLRFIVLINLTEWILFCGTTIICTLNIYLFYQYLQWTDELDRLILRWLPMFVLLLITYLISNLFFSVYDMAIKSLFLCFLEDFHQNDGSIEHPYMMNNELLRLVQKTNSKHTPMEKTSRTTNNEN